MVFYGGHSAAAARRAGRFGLGLFAEGGGEVLEQTYLDAAAEAGHEPGMVMIPDPDLGTSVFVAEDVDTAWERIGPHLLHDATTYAEWMGPNHDAVSKSSATTIEELRQQNAAYRILTPDEAVALIRSGRPLMLQPLSGGCPPELAWNSLELIGSAVLPALA
jgi:alkanesulfonate monooxygenase SsuD/methylene tetrahydromethanopterin reductase-like flavin-dependent oxidoreductase (luciferase family)